MRRNLVLLAVIAMVGVAAFAFNAGADTVDRGRTLGQRVTELENRADRQARAIDTLQAENNKQAKRIAGLVAFREDIRRWKAHINQLTSKLNGRGVYTGPVDNGQVQVGNDPDNCGGQVAEWNDTAMSLGCVTP
jgi:uncharacterized coiled-coil protein SlyX